LKNVGLVTLTWRVRQREIYRKREEGDRETETERNP